MILSRKDKIISLILAIAMAAFMLASIHNYILTTIFSIKVIRLYYDTKGQIISIPTGIWSIGWSCGVGLFFYFVKSMYLSYKQHLTIRIYLILMPLFIFYLVVYSPFYFFPFSNLIWFHLDLIGFTLICSYLINEWRMLIVYYDKQHKSLAKTLKKQRITIAEKRKLLIELDSARKIQKTILPLSAYESLNGRSLKVSARLKPARFVSGDFYLYMPLKDNSFFFAVGDISGKGLPAAMFMLRVDNLIKEKLVKYGGSLSKIMFELNNGLKFNNDMCIFTTLCCCIINTKKGKLKVCNAGHTPPITYRDGQYHFLDTSSNPMIGAVGDIEFKTDHLLLEDYGRIMIYSDGLIDFPLSGKKYYEPEDLLNDLNRVKNMTLDETVEYVISNTEKLQSNLIKDDITFLGLEYAISRNLMEN